MWKFVRWWWSVCKLLTFIRHCPAQLVSTIEGKQLRWELPEYWPLLHPCVFRGILHHILGFLSFMCMLQALQSGNRQQHLKAFCALSNAVGSADSAAFKPNYIRLHLQRGYQLGKSSGIHRTKAMPGHLLSAHSEALARMAHSSDGYLEVTAFHWTWGTKCPWSVMSGSSWGYHPTFSFLLGIIGLAITGWHARTGLSRNPLLNGLQSVPLSLKSG